MAEKIKGLDILLYVEEKVVGGQRGASLSITADDIDVTDKTTGQYKAFLAGLKEWSISCDGLVVTDDAGYVALVEAFLEGKKVMVELKHQTTAANFSYYGEVVISSMDFDAQYDDALTYSCELKGAGPLNKGIKPEEEEGQE